MPDRLPSLIVLVGFWVPPALVGWAAAGPIHRMLARDRFAIGRGSLTVLLYALAWFNWNVKRMPPYIPGAAIDPTVATPLAVRALAIFTATLILPGSALAFALAYRHRRALG